MNCKLIKLVNR